MATGKLSLPEQRELLEDVWLPTSLLKRQYELCDKLQLPLLKRQCRLAHVSIDAVTHCHRCPAYNP